MRKNKMKIMLVMPLSTTDWGEVNAGGVDTVCQLIGQYIASNESHDFKYRIVAIAQLGNHKACNQVIKLSDNVEIVWINDPPIFLNSIRVPSLFYYSIKVRQQAKDFCPDVIHTHLWSAILGCGRVTPSLVTVHSYKNIGRDSVSKANDFLYVKVLPQVYKYIGNIIICVGEALKATVSKDVKQHVTTIQNPINPVYFVPRTTNEKKETLKFITCSMLKPRKQIDKMITLVGLLTKSGVKCKLDIVGPDDGSIYISELKKKITDFNLTHQVTFLGRLNQPQIIEKYKNSDVGLFFSREETFGLAPLEMLASGLPVLATRVGVLAERESYFSGIGATFVDIDNEDEMLSKALDLLKKLDEIRVDIVSLKKAYTVESVVHAYENIYQELVI